MKEDLDDITRLFTRSSREAFKMKNEIMGMNEFVEGKNYQILSRFLSGTGAWKILNKAKATVMTMVQLIDRTERKSLQEAKRFESLTKALDDRQKLQNLQAALEADNIDAIKENFKHFDAMVEILGSKEKVLASIAEKTTKQLEIQQDIIAAATDERSPIAKMQEFLSEKAGTLVAGGTTGNKSAIMLKDAIKNSSLMQATILTGGFTLSHKYLKDMLVVNEDLNKWNKKNDKLKNELSILEGQGDIESIEFWADEERTKKITELKKKISKHDSEKPDRPSKFKDILLKAGAMPENITDAALEHLKDITDKTEDYGKWGNKLLESRLVTGKLIPEYPENEGGTEMFPNATEKMNKFFSVFNRLNVAKGLMQYGKMTRDFLANAPSNLWKGFTGFFKGMKMIFKVVGKFMLYFTLIITGLFFLYRAFKMIEAPLKEGFEAFLNVWEVFREIIGIGFALISEGLSDIIHGFKTGDFTAVIWGLIQIAIGLLTVAWGVFVGVIFGLLAGMWATLKGIFTQGDTAAESIARGVTSLLYIAAAIAIIVGGIYSFPLLIAGAFLGLVAIIADTVMAKIWPYADGGITRTGLSLVGEKGPELVKLPAGSRVYSNADSQKMLSGGTTIQNNITVTGRVGASDSEIKDIANKLSRELNNRMNRTGSAVSVL